MNGPLAKCLEKYNKKICSCCVVFIDNEIYFWYKYKATIHYNKYLVVMLCIEKRECIIKEKEGVKLNTRSICKYTNVNTFEYIYMIYERAQLFGKLKHKLDDRQYWVTPYILYAFIKLLPKRKNKLLMYRIWYIKDQPYLYSVLNMIYLTAYQI